MLAVRSKAHTYLTAPHPWHSSRHLTLAGPARSVAGTESAPLTTPGTICNSLVIQARSPWICQHRPCSWTNATTAIGEGYDAGDGLIRWIVAKNAARRQWGYPLLISATGR
jgi:hypothetical protein